MQISFLNQAYDLPAFLKLCQSEINIKDTATWKQALYRIFIDWHDTSETLSVHTSGSTGEAKKIRIQKQYMRASARATLQFLDIKPESWAWLCMSSEYIAGIMMIVRALEGNLNLWISEPTLHPSVPELNNIALAAMVPMQISSWVALESEGEMLEKRITHLLIGGASIEKSLEMKLSSMTGFALWHTYGMTETISHVALRRINGSETTSGYAPLPGVQISINDKDCLVIDYPTIGITNLHTNDLAEINTNHRFTLKGRADWIINSGGIKVNPESIERKLEGHLPCPFFITWIPDPLLGQKIILCLENDGDLLSQICSIWKTIEYQCNKSHLLREICFIDRFKRTETGKIRREDTRLLAEGQKRQQINAAD